ncbi:unnamed protein product [Adineta ricciae]|uniref:Ubiquitinyl hydrolase 1 n=1 Tax=Adineta ricciae TaxID=249248 RepID=A0A814YCG9_ADIRI|nr:unnamed protein product [Adineta ricciae]CAF1227926.1 unnamed protein product [Adineta ricciae]
MSKHSRKFKTVRSLYFEKQKSKDSCRIHAINNALGQSILSEAKFFEYCDEFDKQNRCAGSRDVVFIHSINNNIFNFILNKFHATSSYYPPNNPPELKKNFSDDCASVIIFDDGHVWCAKKHDDSWYVLDSVANRPEAIEFEDIFNGQGFGWIIVWENGRLPIVEESRKRSSKK